MISAGILTAMKCLLNLLLGQAQSMELKMMMLMIAKR